MMKIFTRITATYPIVVEIFGGGLTTNLAIPRAALQMGVRKQQIHPFGLAFAPVCTLAKIFLYFLF